MILWSSWSSVSLLLCFCLFNKELNLFLIICSVRVPSRTGTNLHHLLPFSATKRKITRSSSGVQLPFFFLSSRWFNHLSRQCFGDLNNWCLDSLKYHRETSFQWPSPAPATALVRRASSSGVQEIFPWGLMRFRYWKWRKSELLPKKRGERLSQASGVWMRKELPSIDRPVPENGHRIL